MQYRLTCILLLLTATAVWAGSSWVLNTSASSETFNGITAPDIDFAIAVGENGSIVHFANGDTTGTLVPSGTSSELFDVYATSRNMAVATGEDIVLLWDGVSWEPIVELSPPSNTVITGAWISPEEDVVWYGIPGASFDQVCPFVPGGSDPLFCRLFGSPMLTACGNSGDAKLLLSSGDIWNLDNELVEANGTIAPLHDEAGNLFLTGIYVSEEACLSGPFAPLQIFAIQNGQTFMQFDGSNWSSMGVTVPAGQTLTWIGGTGPGNLIATGFEPDGMGGNQGVIWHYDGTTWAEDTNLPPGTPGLTDVAANLVFDNDIFESGFENSTRSQLKMSPGTRVNILAAAEQGIFLSNEQLFPLSTSDVGVSTRLLTPTPIRMGDQIQLELTLFNSGPDPATDFIYISGYRDQLLFVSDDCEFTNSFDVGTGWFGRSKIVPLLAQGEQMQCTQTFDVTGDIGAEIRHNLGVIGVDDTNKINNGFDFESLTIQAPL